MRARTTALLGLCLFLVGALAPTGASAAPGPAWELSITPAPANLAPGREGQYLLLGTNLGGGPTTAPSTIELTLPDQLVPKKVTAFNSTPGSTQPTCEPIATQTLHCETPVAIDPGRQLSMQAAFEVKADAPTGATLEAQATVGGGGAQSATAISKVPVQSAAVSFDFLGSLSAPLSEADGAPAGLAGAHPYQQTVAFGFPTKDPGDGLTNAGHPRDIYTELPRGLIGNPGASEALCTEFQLVIGKCPPSSQVGVIDTTSLVGDVTGITAITSPLYDMVPPPGVPAELATDAANAGIFVHLMARVRAESDYGVQTATRDVLAFGTQPIFNVQGQVWGDPTAEVHDPMRGDCLGVPASCPAPRAEEAFLTLPGDCPAKPLGFEVLADSWEEPSPPGPFLHTAYESADLAGDPVSLSGCGALQFDPTIEAKPSTSKAESPAGLDFRLHQPQQGPGPEPLSGRATAILKDTVVTFPAGLQVNPSQANGLDACSEAQIGFKGEENGTPRFTEAAQSCPDASKLGTVVAKTPLLPERNAAHEVTPQLLPLHGAIYLARPFANPFGSLIALYVVVEDEQTGIVAKLAGEGRLDPDTGQITTTFKESPEVPIEDIEVSLFGGDRGALITPPTCAKYTTAADLTPWSAPEGEVAHPGSDFEVSEAPAGGPCPAARPNAPALVAGTLEPVAGKYSTMSFHLSRSDGSERFSRIEATLPAGLTAKLAGVARCSDADIAKAKAREAPDKGVAEVSDPSCPAPSEVGTVSVTAGAGPNPFRIAGRAYLAGPYEGAPLSFAIITPAVAGPFDLGAVVLRTPVFIDPDTARPRAVSDPLPQLIEGVPSDVRSVTLRLDRPDFVLNPTSCDEEAFEGTAVSALGHPAPLFERFQVGGCSSLPFKPRLNTRLFGGTTRGAHPRLRAIFTARPGEANTARLSFALPHSEFIDQAHFRTICTRVQFAAKACPAGSIYGHMKAITPLLDSPLEGPIYLRSSSHQLPDVVVALQGPPSLPIEIDLDGRVDSVRGGVRTTFEAVPDAPVTKAIVTMQGKRKGLFQNSTNICKGTHRATLLLDGQNGKTHDARPPLKASCPKSKPKKKKHRRPHS